MSAERRLHQRFEIVAQVEMEADDETVLLSLVNLSRGGAMLAISGSAPAIEVGTEVSAFLDFGSDELGENRAISLEAVVVRIEGRGIAVRWTSGSAASRQKLSEIIDELEDAGA